MPTIVNAYSGNASIADSLKSLGDSMFGNQAQRELIRQNALAKGAENQYAEPFANAVRDGDRNSMAYYGALARKSGQDTANFNRLGVTNHAGIDDPAVALAQIGAGSSVESTPVGQNRALANARTLNDMTTARTLEGEKYKFNNTPVPVYENGRVRLLPQSQAVDGTHEGAPLSKDQVVAGVINDQLHGGQPGQQGAAPSPTNTAAPNGYIHPAVQEALGYPKGATAYQHLQSGAIGQSYDGGAHIDGAPAGPGWVQVAPEAAVTQTRMNQQIDKAKEPLPPPPTQYSQAAEDAGKTSGLKAAVQHAANATWGLVGGGEVNPDMNRGRENLTNLANESRSILLSTPGRASVTAQHWANASIPQPGILGMTGTNAAEEKNTVVMLTQHLRQVYDMEAREVADPSTDPKQREALIGHMRQVKNVIQRYEAPPVQPSQPAAAAAPPGQNNAPAAPAAASPVLRYDAQGNRVQ